jgi:Fe-S-cluster containining protein
MAEDGSQGPGPGSPERPPKFIYECVRCGHSCQDRNVLVITLRDIKHWVEDQTLEAIYAQIRLVDIGMPFLEPALVSEEGLKAFREGDKEHKGCPLYDRENKLCNIYSSMPLACRAFPLAYDGERFLVRDRECKGLGQGEMTADRLKAHRDAAREEHEALLETAMLIPAMQGMFTKYFWEESNRTLEAMSDEDRKKIEEVLSHARQEDKVVEDGDSGSTGGVGDAGGAGGAGGGGGSDSAGGTRGA